MPACGPEYECVDRACVKRAAPIEEEAHASAPVDDATPEPDATPIRIQVGPAVLVDLGVGFASGLDPVTLGGAFAIDVQPLPHGPVAQILFVGVRGLTTVDFGGGFAGVFDVDVGVRFHAVRGERHAFNLVAATGLGGAVFAVHGNPLQGALHVPARVGLGFDAGAFTLEAVGGVALFRANGSAVGLDASLLLGARF